VAGDEAAVGGVAVAGDAAALFCRAACSS
jgi:hypothetical protein